MHGLADASRKTQHSDNAEQHSHRSSRAFVDTLPRKRAFTANKLPEWLQEHRADTQNTRHWAPELIHQAVLDEGSDIDVLVKRLHNKDLKDNLSSDPLRNTAKATRKTLRDQMAEIRPLHSSRGKMPLDPTPPLGPP